jgi:hypothetical protein
MAKIIDLKQVKAGADQIPVNPVPSGNDAPCGIDYVCIEDNPCVIDYSCVSDAPCVLIDHICNSNEGTTSAAVD